MKKLTAVVIGAGQRGKIYTDVMAKHTDKFEIKAVADPVESRCEYIRSKHGFGKEMCFDSWDGLFAKGKIADVALITTMDRAHFEPAMKAIELGYDLLLEKPVSIDPYECKKIADAAKAHGTKVVVCYVLRYTSIFSIVKNMIDEGKLGEIVGINHEENVGNIHHSHSYVRGNWANLARSSFMLLAKACHDMDLIQWMIGKKCLKVQSFGALSYFTREHAPTGSTEFCIDGCPLAEDCPYNAVKLYLDDKDNSWFREHCTGQANPTDEMVEASLYNTNYGRCVFKCDNDVVDHQTLNMLFEDNVTATFTMNSMTRGGRWLHVMGTHGEVHLDVYGERPIRFDNLLTGETSYIDVPDTDSGHYGGDEGVVMAMYQYITGEKDFADMDISDTNSYIAFAAEKARLTGTIIDMDEYVSSLDK